MQIDVIIPVYKPGEEFLQLLSMLQKQTREVHEILIMNTEQKYWDALLQNHPQVGVMPKLKVWHLSGREFDHGNTRREGVAHSLAEIFVMMTQDAVPADEQLIERLGKALLQPNVAVAYARQLPREQAGAVERFTREFNYPPVSHIKTIADKESLGIKTYFCSNVCAAYRRDIYETRGGFVKQAIFNEDMVYAAGCIEAGYGVAYEAQAQVVHSHAYTNKQQFHRNFDVGVSQREFAEIFDSVPSESEGIRLVKQTAKYLRSQHQSRLILPMMVTSAYKYLGYRLGRKYDRLSHGRVLKYTMNPEYFRRKGY